MKRVMAIVLSFLLVAAVSFAVEKGEWWSNLKGKIDKLSPPKTTTTTTAVGGVRGAKDDSETVYWKGKEKIVAKEFQSFVSAMNSAIEGKTEEAITGFKGFLKEYPTSALAEDAKESLRILTAK